MKSAVAPDHLPQLESWLANCRKAASGSELVGLFHCQGALAEPARQAMLASQTPLLVRFAEMASCADGQPDDAALARTSDWARETGERVDREMAEERQVRAIQERRSTGCDLVQTERAPRR